MHVDQRLTRPRDVEQRVARGRHLAQPLADDEEHVRLAHARGERRVDADADVAGVVRVAMVEQVLPAESATDRPAPALRQRAEGRGVGGVPAAPADDGERAPGAGEQRVRAIDRVRIGRDRRGLDARRVVRHGLRGQHVLGQRDHDRSRAAGHRDGEGARDRLRDALGAVDLLDVLRRSSRTCAGSRLPGTPRARGSRCRPGPPAAASASSPAARRAPRSRRSTRPVRASRSPRPGVPRACPWPPP